jgi:hypothetical protein
MRIEIDDLGYPTDASLAALKAWDEKPTPDNLGALLDAVADYFEGCGYGRARKRTTKAGTVWRFATGGWSGCEDVIDNLPWIAGVAWRSSHRGGLHIYGLDKWPEGR